ncbi:hypothetical protein D3C71_1512090 [compost metagenome]
MQEQRFFLLQRAKASHFHNPEQALATQHRLHHQMAGGSCAQLRAHMPERFGQILKLTGLAIQRALAKQPLTEFKLGGQRVLTVHRITAD